MQRVVQHDGLNGMQHPGMCYTVSIRRWRLWLVSESIDLKLRSVAGKEKDADEPDGKTESQNAGQHLGIEPVGLSTCLEHWRTGLGHCGHEGGVCRSTKDVYSQWLYSQWFIFLPTNGFQNWHPTWHRSTISNFSGRNQDGRSAQCQSTALPSALPSHSRCTSSLSSMAPSKAANHKTGGGKKEKVFHPQSRKAGQLVRTQLRKGKLFDQAKERNKKLGSQGNSCLFQTKRIDLNVCAASVYSFFYHALPPEGELSLEELHFVVRDIWLPRFDQEIEAEKASRRKGRPKSVKEQKLEEQKLRETEGYRTGIGEYPRLSKYSHR